MHGKLVLEPRFGVKAWGANSTCADVHPRGPIPEGDRRCCMHCHVSGLETHRDLKITSKDNEAVANFKPATPDGRDQWSPVIDKDVEMVMVSKKAKKRKTAHTRSMATEPQC